MNTRCALTSEEYKACMNDPHTASYFCELGNITKGFKVTKAPSYTYKTQNTIKHKGHSNLRKGSISNHHKPGMFETMEDVLDLDVPFEKLKYEAPGLRPTSVIHLGQLKLFLSTFQFIYKYADMDKTTHVVYPGSAPGNNINLLTELFPNVVWYLYDPRSFDSRLKNNPRVAELVEDYFTDEIASRLANQLKGSTVLLISDIRNCEDMKEDLKEQFVYDNQELQRTWVELLKPSWAQLKFRMPRLPETMTE